MNNFEISLKNRKARIIPINIIRAKSLIVSSEEAIKNAKEISLIEGKQKTILRELYEGLRQLCEAVGYSKGYQFFDHESITFFLKEVLKEEIISAKFDRYRKLRNGINYYGNELSLITVKESLKEIPHLVRELKKYFSN